MIALLSFQNNKINSIMLKMALKSYPDDVLFQVCIVDTLHILSLLIIIVIVIVDKILDIVGTLKGGCIWVGKPFRPSVCNIWLVGCAGLPPPPTMNYAD